MITLFLAISTIMARPGGFVCEVKSTRTYYAYNQCFQGDVVTGARWDGYQMLLLCQTLTVVCPKTNECI